MNEFNTKVFNFMAIHSFSSDINVVFLFVDQAEFTPEELDSRKRELNLEVSVVSILFSTFCDLIYEFVEVLYSCLIFSVGLLC